MRGILRWRGTEKDKQRSPLALEALRLRPSTRRKLTPFLIFLVTLSVYWIVCYKEAFHQSVAPHHVYQAFSFLHGKLYLENPIPHAAFYQGKAYVVQGPVPSLVMLPFVAFFGKEMNDIIFTLILGAINPILLYLVLRRYKQKDELRLEDNEILWLTFFFAFGTVHFFLSVHGAVWHTTQIVTTTMTLIYILLASGMKRPILSGIFSFLAFASRGNLIMGWLFYPLSCFLERAGKKSLARSAFLFLAPIFMLGLCLGYFNYVRFGNPFESGYSQLLGRFNLSWKFIPQTFYFTYLLPPVFRREFPYLWFNGYGMSFFIVMPAFLSILWVRKITRKMIPFLVTTFSIAFPMLFWDTPGFYTFGPRYALDFIPYLIIFLSLGLSRLNKAVKFLILCSIAFNTWGAMIFSYELWPEIYERMILHNLLSGISTIFGGTTH